MAVAKAPLLRSITMLMKGLGAMPSIEEMFTAAEEAVATQLQDIADDWLENWRDVSPESIGFSVDSWLKFSTGIIKAFNRSSGVAPINLSEPARASYYDQPLLTFVVALADGAEQVS